MVKIIQFGDIHYPDDDNKQARIDGKDDGFPKALSAALAPTPLLNVIRTAREALADDKIKALTFMGDYTTHGNADGLNNCLKYINSALLGSAWGARPKENIIFVPGNHDINRALATSPDGSKKFQQIKDALKSEGLPTIPIDNPIKTTIRPKKNVGIELFALNSCLGCGEHRNLPSKLRQKLTQAIEDELADGALGADERAALTESLYEELDTPALAHDCVAKVLAEIQALPPNVVPVLVAHHNLLPQSTPRLAPYTEMMNSGSIRDTLLRLKRPVLFLHGHIHADVVEVISQPSHPDSQLILISAPLLRDGYNIIELFFLEDGTSIGCEVHHARHNNASQLTIEQRTTIPFTKAGTPLSKVANQVLGCLHSRGLCYVADVPGIYKSSHGADLSQSDLSQSLIELKWQNLIRLDGTEHERDLLRTRVSTVH